MRIATLCCRTLKPTRSFDAFHNQSSQLCPNLFDKETPGRVESGVRTEPGKSSGPEPISAGRPNRGVDGSIRFQMVGHFDVESSPAQPPLMMPAPSVRSASAEPKNRKRRGFFRGPLGPVALPPASPPPPDALAASASPGNGDACKVEVLGDSHENWPGVIFLGLGGVGGWQCVSFSLPLSHFGPRALLLGHLPRRATQGEGGGRAAPQPASTLDKSLQSVCIASAHAYVVRRSAP